jgi:hypothetical protein
MDLIIDAIGRADARIDKMADALGEVGAHCATLLERTEHLATREDVSTVIRTHVAELHRRGAHDSLAPRRLNGSVLKLVKALAAFLTVASAAIAAYFGFSN